MKIANIFFPHYRCVAFTVIIYNVFVNLWIKPIVLWGFLLPLIACFCSSGLLSCGQIRWGDLSKCCRVLQLWECHLITRAHCVTSCCVLEEAWVSVCSLNSMDCRLQNLNRFQSPVPQPVAPLFFFFPPCFPPPCTSCGTDWLSQNRCVLIFQTLKT